MELEFENVGTLKCVHFKTYYKTSLKLEINEVKVSIEGENGPVETKFKAAANDMLGWGRNNLKICGGGKKPTKKAPKPQGSGKKGSTLGPEDVDTGGAEDCDDCTNFKNGLDP